MEVMNIKEVKAEEILLDNGYEDVMIFTDFSYDTALIGITSDNRAVYDYDLMVEWLVDNQGMTYEEANDWVSYNTIRSLDYTSDNNKPIVLFKFME